MVIIKKCFSCGKDVDPVSDYCYGCGNYVCLECAKKYSHFAGGEHGRGKKKKK